MQTLIKRMVEINSAQTNIVQAILARRQLEPTASKEELSGLSEAQQEAVMMDKVEELVEKTQRPSISPMLASIIAKRKAAEEALAPEPDEVIGSNLTEPIAPAEDVPAGTGESFSLNITLNEKQLVAKQLAFQGKSFCLIGPAGTGKTTAQRAVARALLDAGNLDTSNFKVYDPVTGNSSYKSAPSIAFCAYTRRAASNLRKAIHKDPVLQAQLANNILTIHALLEYQPETYFDAVEGKEKFRFAPMRTAKNPLNITHLVIEEASMLGLDLWEKLYDALPPGVQIIFIGDINQLPPVFGPSILNYALLQLPIVELTQVYRNQGIVLENAHNILAGRMVVESKDYQIIRGSSDKQHGQIKTAMNLANMFKILSETPGDDGLMQYDPENDIILSPFNNKGGRDKEDTDGYHLGTFSINKWIAQFIGEKRDAVVHEIIAGFNRQYLAVGDKVMVNKRDGVIVDIIKNPSYFGKEPQLPGKDLSRFGIRILGKDSDFDFDMEEDATDLNYDNFSLERLAEEQAERKQQASHIVKVDFGDGVVEDITAAGDFAPAVFSLGYALTVHKSQGSEWRKVFIIFHKDHSTMLFRELFYTAATRARTKVAIIAKDFIVKKAIETQRIKGNTIKDKLAFFNSGINDTVSVSCTK